VRRNVGNRNGQIRRLHCVSHSLPVFRGRVEIWMAIDVDLGRLVLLVLSQLLQSRFYVRDGDAKGLSRHLLERLRRRCGKFLSKAKLLVCCKFLRFDLDGLRLVYCPSFDDGIKQRLLAIALVDSLDSVWIFNRTLKDCFWLWFLCRKFRVLCPLLQFSE